MFYQKLQTRQNNLQQQIHQLKQSLAQYPEGKLVCYSNGKYTKNLYVSNGTRTCIPKSNTAYAQLLSQKKLLTAQLHDLQTEERAIASFLKHYQNYASETEQLLANPTYRKLIGASFSPVSDELARWSQESYPTNPLYPDQLRHPCFSNHKVRSKSEALIDQALFIHQIPFRYECALTLAENTFYPDFTIRHPKNGAYFYWEHFGLMDSPSYSQKAFQKLQTYAVHGYIPSINLITTFETSQTPLTTEVIENTIQQYLL